MKNAPGTLLVADLNVGDQVALHLYSNHGRAPGSLRVLTVQRILKTQVVLVDKNGVEVCRARIEGSVISGRERQVAYPTTREAVYLAHEPKAHEIAGRIRQHAAENKFSELVKDAVGSGQLMDADTIASLKAALGRVAEELEKRS